MVSGSERRRSRESFEKTLNTICKRLDASSRGIVASKDWLSRRPVEATVEVVSMWVVGSFARGAPDCGDLDLVLEYKTLEGRDPGGSRVGRSLLGKFPDVRVYGGVPHSNESGVEFSEAVVIWEGKGSGWKNAIRAIPVIGYAGRFCRPTDRIPLRAEQLAIEVEALESIEKMEADRLIQWRFIPLEDITPITPESEDELELVRLFKISAGQKSQKLLPYILAYFRGCCDSLGQCLRDGFKPTEFAMGGTKVLLGKPHLRLNLLEDVAVSELIVVPHVSSRGPNGIWSIQRGSAHPLEQRMASLGKYVITDAKGEPSTIYRVNESGFGGPAWCSLARTLDLYTTAADALAHAKDMSLDFEEEFGVLYLKGTELLRVVSCLDIVIVDGAEQALTWMGQRSLGVDAGTEPGDFFELLTAGA